MLSSIILWVHLLCMIGAFGGLLAGRLTLSTNDSTSHRSVLKPVNVMLAIGLAAGLLSYFLKINAAGASGEELTGHVHMIVGIKFMILLGAAACCGIATGLTRKERGSAAGRLQWVACGLLAIAAYLGVSL